MAFKIQINQKNAQGGYDAFYPKTSSDMVLDEASGKTAAEHFADKTNPHGVTKAQVGLPETPNFGVATKAEAEAGTAANKLMTPQRTNEAILKLAPPPTAEKVTITDAGNYYTGTNTEAALQEIGNVLAGTKTNLAAVAQELIRL